MIVSEGENGCYEKMPMHVDKCMKHSKCPSPLRFMGVLRLTSRLHDPGPPRAFLVRSRLDANRDPISFMPAETHVSDFTRDV